MAPQPVPCVPSTVLLLNPVEVQAEFLAVADKLSTPGQSPHGAYSTLLLHAFQATFGARCDLPRLHRKLQVMAREPGSMRKHWLQSSASLRSPKYPCQAAAAGLALVPTSSRPESGHALVTGLAAGAYVPRRRHHATGVEMAFGQRSGFFSWLRDT